MHTTHSISTCGHDTSCGAVPRAHTGRYRTLCADPRSLRDGSRAPRACHALYILQISSKSCNDRKDQLFSLLTHMLHTTVTARARRTRCAHAQLAPTDFSDTCLSAHCLRPPPGRTHSPPTVALALLEPSQRLPKPPTPPLPRPRRDPPAADRALPPQQRCLEPRPNAHSNPPEETPPPDANDATAACAVRVLRRCHARCGSRCAQTAAPSRAPSPQHCTQLHPGALTNGRHSSTNFSIRCLSGEARQYNAYLDNKRGADTPVAVAPVDKSVCHSWRLQLEESSGGLAQGR